MYGTIARIRLKEGKFPELQALFNGIGLAKGQVARYLYRLDADADEYIAVSMFDNREAYRANANSPDQHEVFTRFRALLDADPEWNDGEIVDLAVR